MNATQNIGFSRWTKGSIDRFYVNGVAGLDCKVYLERLGDDDFTIRTTGTTNTIEKIIAHKDTTAALEAIFGGRPTWSQMIDACN